MLPRSPPPSAREAYVIRRWADVAWVVPPVISTRLGEQPILATQVVRASDRLPAANYRVHYRLLDGPDALFALNRLTESEVAAVNGSARVALYEPQARPGRNRVAVELIRTNSTSADARPEVIAQPDDGRLGSARGESVISRATVGGRRRRSADQSDRQQLRADRDLHRGRAHARARGFAVSAIRSSRSG